jgi:SSS family solute:Na+ symporter
LEGQIQSIQWNHWWFFFLALSYFGTDQSQVGRYLTAKNLSESRRGLLMNGFVKIPMQFFDLTGGSDGFFTFYTMYEGPINYNSKQLEQARIGIAGNEIVSLESQYSAVRKQNEQICYSLFRCQETKRYRRRTKNSKMNLPSIIMNCFSLRKSAAEQIKKIGSLSGHQ